MKKKMMNAHNIVIPPPTRYIYFQGLRDPLIWPNPQLIGKPTKETKDEAENQILNALANVEI